MIDAGSAGIPQGWMITWNLGLSGLLAATLIGVGLIALIEVIAAIRRDRG